MDALLHAAGDFLAALLRALGYVGRPRRRAEICADLDLLAQIREAGLGEQSAAERLLLQRLEQDVARLVGVPVEGDKTRPRGTILFAFIVGLPAAYWTYWLIRDGFDLLALLPGAAAFFFLVGGSALLINGSSDDEEEQAKSRER